MYNQPLNYFADFELRKFQKSVPINRGRANRWSKASFSKELIINPGNISGASINSRNISGINHGYNSQNDIFGSFNKPKKQQKKISHFQKLYRFVYEFLDNSSIHGFGHLTATKRHIAEYIIWSIFLLAAIGGTVYIGTKAWLRYQYDPTVIAMERDYKNWNTSFPTAAVCPDEKLDEDKLKDLAKNKYKVKDVEKFIKFFKVLALMEFETFGDIADYDEVKPEDYMKVLVEAAFGYSYEVSNSYDSESGELTPIITEMGLCYTYNSKVAIHFTPENFFKKSVDKHATGTVIYGSPLDGELFSQIMTMNSGYNMTITGPYDIPDVSTKRMNSEPLYYKTVELTALSIISSDSVRNLNLRQRKCRYYDESDLEISDIYTYILCRMQCRLDLAFKLCKCIPFFYRKLDKKPYCDPKGLQCLAQYGKFLADLREAKTNKKAECNCLPLCNDVHFMVEMDNTMSWKIATNLKWGMIRYPRIRLKRDIIFSFSDLLVSVGGTAALFLGCSVLSFVEVLYFFTLRLVIFIWRQCKK